MGDVLIVIGICLVAIGLIGFIVDVCRHNRPIAVHVPQPPDPPTKTIDFVKLAIPPKRVSQIADETMGEIMKTEQTCVHIALTNKDKGRIIRIEINIDPYDL